MKTEMGNSHINIKLQCIHIDYKPYVSTRKNSSNTKLSKKNKLQKITNNMKPFM